MNDNELIEVPGNAAVDLAGVTIFKYVLDEDVADHEAKGWTVDSRAGELVRMHIKAEEYFN